jgi:hypothetical protein
MRALIPDSVAIDCRILALLVRASRISHLRVRVGSASFRSPDPTPEIRL